MLHLPDTHFVRASILATKRLIGLMLLCAAALLTRTATAGPDILYVGDATGPNPFATPGTNLIHRLDADTGAEILGGNPGGVYVLPGSNDLDGPRGVIQLRDSLLGSRSAERRSE
jgi:hypothetical protein